MNKKIVHDALFLAVLTLIIGCVLGAVYGVTKDPIAKTNYEATQKAYKAVFESADKFEVVDFDANQAASLLADKGFKDSIDDIESALDSSNNIIGYVITVTAKDGSQGSITFSVGIQMDGTVNGYSITSIAETPGLGMKAKDEDFYSQFQGKKVSSFSVVKTEASADNEIEAITGSTITSKAIANGCNAAILYFNECLGGAQ